MPKRVDPDERFKLDMEPEEAIRKFLDGDSDESDEGEPEPENTEHGDS